MPEHHTTIRLEEYKEFPFAAENISLTFQLDEEGTTVTAISNWKRHTEGTFTLFGEELELHEIAINNTSLLQQEYSRNEQEITIPAVPDHFELRVATKIYPENNNALEGLYKSSGNYCTQCEAEGFRKITYFADRPDVLTTYTTRIEANKANYPVLLANGNNVERGELEGGRHFAVWHDPFPKPSYLFALVAGKLVALEDSFTTKSGREIALKIFVEERNQGRCDHAMASLKKSMRWDEEVFGLEYDLDIFMIVAVDDFNMGAMENKGLNIFNSKYVLTTPETATDQDYLGVEGVIAHEYFHNWTGNRVTCRNWFQLSLKEGLTVFRDQEFSSDMNSRSVQRIDDVRILKSIQFKEDAGPLAHPIRPEHYQEINNFYTATVYNKGAEVIRMIHTIIGANNFGKGMDLYFARHDGQAVTCEDFVAAMADASGVDLEQFSLWYRQAGTPELTVRSRWSANEGKYTIHITQHCPDTPGQKEKKPFHIPIKVGLIGINGAVPFRINGEQESHMETVLELRENEQDFAFSCNNESEPTLSFLRDFSAPVRVKSFQKRQELARLAAQDSNLFNRWDSAARLSSEVILEVAAQLQEGKTPTLDPVYCEAMQKSLEQQGGDTALLALALQLPSETTLAQEMEPVDPEALHNAHLFVKQRLAEENRDRLLVLYSANKNETPYAPTFEQIGQRSLKNVALDYLMQLNPLPQEILKLCINQFEAGANMTDTMAALALLNNVAGEVRDTAFAQFYAKWQNDPLVMDKWFSLQAVSSLPDTLQRVESLCNNPLFSITNPNKVRALIGSFSSNHCRFHNKDGAGYRFLADKILELNAINPQIAARLATLFGSWRRYREEYATLMEKELQRIAGNKELSRDVYEIVNKSLA